MQSIVAPQTLDVTVRSIRFSSPATGYTIAMVAPKEARQPKQLEFAAVGVLGTLQVGEEVRLTGSRVEHPKYGAQFEVSGMEFPNLHGTGMLDFLMAGYLKGIGPEKAMAIHTHFGDTLADVLGTAPQRLTEVKGIGPKMIDGIVESWREHSGKREALAFFSRWRIGPMTMQKIFKRWPNPRDAVDTVRTDPYILAWEIHGIGFHKADEIAMAIGFDKLCASRLQAALGYALDTAAQNNGHCYLPKDELISNTMALLWPPAKDKSRTAPAGVEETLCTALSDLVFAGRIVKDEERYYLAGLFKNETLLAQNITRITTGKIPGCSRDRLNTLLNNFEAYHKITLDPLQREAVCAALLNKVCVITGGPGTGKTTIIRALIALSAAIGIENIALSAPTGKAAKRMQEATEMPAKTVHRLLGYNPQQGYEYDETNPHPATMLIVDEASMLDVYLASSFMKAVQSMARVVFVGDVDQLPSVGPGNVLKDLITSGSVAVARLEQVYRQSARSYISVNAQALRTGSITAMNLSNETDDFFWISLPPSQIAAHGETRELTVDEKAARYAHGRSLVLKSMTRLMEKGFDPLDILVLSPIKKGELGVETLNKEIRDLLNPSGATLPSTGKQYRVGDRVMQLRNNYDKEVFNGDQGIVLGESTEGTGFVVEFDGNPVEYKPQEVNELTLCYAMSVHKSQGSESPAVIQIVSTAHHIMLQRNLLYTGITRAKKTCVLIGDRKAMNIAIRNNRVSKRHTRLADRLHS